MDGQQPRNWWGRNWKWMVPVGCVLPIVLCAGLCAGIVGGFFGVMKSSWAYVEGVELARHNPKVVEKLGEPIETGWMIAGYVNIDGKSGHARQTIPLSGSKNQGTLYVTAEKSAGEWHFEKAEVEIDGLSERINLIPEKDKATTGGQFGDAIEK
jgi:hypothetical protein